MNTALVPHCLSANYTNLNRLLENHFNSGFAYSEIVKFLKVYHNKNITWSTVKNKFEKMGLSWRSIFTQRTPDVEVETVVQQNWQVADRTVGVVVVCGYHYKEKVWLHVEKMCHNFCWDWMRRELKEASRENIGVKFIELWD